MVVVFTRPSLAVYGEGRGQYYPRTSVPDLFARSKRQIIFSGKNTPMAYRRNAKSRPRSKLQRKRKLYRKRPYKRKNSGLVKLINQVLARKVETKISQLSGTLVVRTLTSAVSQAQFNDMQLMATPQGTVNGSIYCDYPVIANGVGQDQRVGDECRIKGQYINFLLQANDYNATTNPLPMPQVVTVWAIKPKIGNQYGLAVSLFTAGTNSNFFETQTSADSGFTGSLVDMMRKVDTDNYTVIYKRTFKIGWAGALNSTDVAATHQNNDYKQFVQGRIKIPGYTWKCDRQDYTQGRYVYVFATCCAADGTTQGPTVVPVSFTYNLATYFTDM